MLGAVVWVCSLITVTGHRLLVMNCFKEPVLGTCIVEHLLEGSYHNSVPINVPYLGGGFTEAIKPKGSINTVVAVQALGSPWRKPRADVRFRLWNGSTE